MSKNILKLRSRATYAHINPLNQQPCSLGLMDKEYIWGGGKPERLKNPEEKRGWQNSAMLMFPIIGRAKNNQILINGELYPMCQHGIARHINSEFVEQSFGVEPDVRFRQIYNANSDVRSPSGNFRFPFSYSLETIYTLKDEILLAQFIIKNISEELMPYAFGWHPAFRIHGKVSDGIIYTPNNQYKLSYVRKLSSSGALRLEGETEVAYKSVHEGVKVYSNLGNMTIWSPPGQPQVCIEPTSALTDAEYSGELKQKHGYKELKKDEEALYFVEIRLL